MIYFKLRSAPLALGATQAAHLNGASRRIALLLSLLLAPGIAFAQAAAPIESFTLTNGMKVVLIPIHRVAAVTHMLWYDVGSADDTPGRSGLAHYNEHMMFQGTEKTKGGVFAQTVARLGGHTNAFTNRDATAYYVSITKEKLPLIMEMEADRMLKLAPTPANFAKEREVIIEERRMSVENQPSSLLGEEMDALLYRNHPYRLPVIGWMQEMQQLTRDDVLAFHQQYYHPANATLVVAGDITRKELESLAEKYYGALPAGKKPLRAWKEEPPQRGLRHIELHHANVKEPIFAYMAVAPSVRDADSTLVLPAYVLAQVLGGGTSSRFYQSLAVKQKLATRVDVEYSGLVRGPGTISIEAVPAQGVSLSVLEAAIRKEIAQTLATPITPDELARAKTLLEAITIYSRDGIEAMARTVGTIVSVGLPPEFFNQWPNLIEKISAEDVNKAAKLLFNPDNAVIGYLLPKEPAQ